MNWPTRKLTVVTGGNGSSGASQTKLLGGSLPQPRTIPCPGTACCKA